MTFKIDDREVIKALKGGALSVQDMLGILKPASLTVVNKQRQDVPVDTAATKTSIRPDIQESSAARVVTHIGPSTDYAPYIEFGVASKPNYPIQPFVRPSVTGNERNIEKVASAAFKATVKRKLHG